MRALLLLVVVVGSAPALAAPVTLPVVGDGSVDVATTTQAEWHGNNYDDDEYNDDYAAEILRWNLTGTTGETTVGLRLDGVFFQSESDHRDCTDDGNTVDECRQQAYLGDPPPGGILRENDLYPERFWVTTRVGPVRPTLGDFTARFGEGLALSVRKIDELGIDTSIRGAEVEAQSEGGLRVIGLGGWTNIQNLDPVNQRLIEDPADLIAGLRIENTFSSGLTVGAHYVGYDYLRATTTSETARGRELNEEGASVFGAGVRAPGLAGILDLALEGDYSTNVTVAPGGPAPIVPPALVEGPGIQKDDGFGVYESLTLNLERTTVLLEGKYYRKFRFADPSRVYITYSEPPTLERNDMLVLNNFNVVAARARGEQRFWGGHLTLFVNVLEGAYDDAGNSPFWDLAHGSGGTGLTHAYVGAERRWTSGAFVSASVGYRREALLSPAPGQDETVYAFPHLEVDAGRPLTASQALEMKAWTWGFVGADGIDVTKANHDYDRASVSLTYSIAPEWAFSVLWGFTSEKDEKIQPRNYLAFQASFTMNEHLTLKAFLAGPWGYARPDDPPALGGRMGGIYCVGGVCRDYPPFEGAQLTALVTY